MKRLVGILLCMLACFQVALAQIESEGTPTPFALPAQTYHRSATSFFYPLQIDTTQALVSDQRNYAIGHVAPVHFTPQKDGIWEVLENGTRVWRMGLVSDGAASMSVVLAQLNLPDGAKLFVYNPSQTQVLGAFGTENQNESGILPIRPLIGDSLILEYQEPSDAAFNGTFCIERVAHNRSTGTFNGSNHCSPHALFTNDLPQQKQSVCLLYVVSSTQSSFGSGCLINNTDGKPYVYTAAHNFKAAEDANRTIFYFNYAVTEQDSTIQGSQECSIGGSILRAWATNIDMALVELNQMPPRDYRPYLAGWNRSKSPQAPLISIQHPKGDSKRMSYANTTPVISDYPGYFENQIKKGWWHISRWSKGCTEAGSSGSPLFDKNGLIIGALSGGQSNCSKPINDYYARLDTAWNFHSDSDKQLACWLDPNHTNATSMPGVDPYAEGTCHRLKHIEKGNNIQALKHSKGYYAGHNQLQHTAFAEKYTTTEEGTLYGAYIMPFKGRYSGDSPVYLTVYSGTDQPTQLLGKVLVRPRDLTCTRGGKWGTATKTVWKNKENYIRFSQPIAVPKTFFVGVEIQYNSLTTSDTLALYQAKTPNNYAYFYNGSSWNPYSAHNISPTNLSLWIEPVHSLGQPTAIESVNQETISIYPNPTPDKVTWEAEHANAYQLYNLQGQLLQKGTDNQVWIPQKGVFVLCLFLDQQPVGIHKVIRY